MGMGSKTNFGTSAMMNVYGGGTGDGATTAGVGATGAGDGTRYGLGYRATTIGKGIDTSALYAPISLDII